MAVEEIKAQLLAKAEKAIKQVMADRPEVREMRLAAIESLAVRAGAAVARKCGRNEGRRLASLPRAGAGLSRMRRKDGSPRRAFSADHDKGGYQ
jgi:hypothetical protein